MILISRSVCRSQQILQLSRLTAFETAKPTIIVRSRYIEEKRTVAATSPEYRIMSVRNRGDGGGYRYGGGGYGGGGYGGAGYGGGGYGGGGGYRGGGRYGDSGYADNLGYGGGGVNNGYNGNYRGEYNGQNRPNGNINPFKDSGQNELMTLMNAMASNFNVNPPPPPPVQMACGDLRVEHRGMLVELSGRLIKKRVSRFVELRDRTGGAVQMVVLEDKYPRSARRIYNMPDNTLLTVVGVVNLRPSNACNMTMPTGEVEVEIRDITSIDFLSNGKGMGNKRSYSTMTNQNSCGITSTEYKIAKTDNILKYFENRDITCNDLRRDDIGKVVTLVGWIPATKSPKFLQLKDGYGQTQIIVENESMQDTCLSAPEGTVVQIKGKVLGRPRANINTKYDTGEVEIMVETVRILNPEEPYDGPIKTKEKVQKMSIDDLDGDETGENAKATGEEGQAAVAEKSTKIADLNKFAGRTHTCGELCSDNINEKVRICGWLEYQRMNKFIILRDGYGQTQVLLTEKSKGLDKYEDGFALESIIHVEGTVIPRPSTTINASMKTGNIEVEAENIEVINPAKKNLPFEVRRHNRAGERLRLTHRYLDLRFTDMQYNLRMRSSVIMRMREYLINYLGFVEVETPTLFRRTPGGAQEFVVPTRKPGHFYSLVQSPQQFKQMLMAGAIDRYFQVARCYRDEATRPDRQPEFTQLDIELSFTTREDIMQLIEELLRYSWPKELSSIQTKFQRITYEEAMDKYGTDKPDTRFGLILNNVTEIIEKSQTFAKKYNDLAAYAIVARGAEVIWNGQTKKHVENLSEEFDGTLYIRKFSQYKEVIDRLTKLLTNDLAIELIEKCELEENDLLFLGIGEKHETQTFMGRLRLEYHDLNAEDKKRIKNEYKFLWVVDFPMFERNIETNTLESVHHPFTAPHPADMEIFMKAKDEELVEVRSQAYDLVLNGQEVGGGSIRIHDRDMQHFVLEQILKIPHEHLDHLLSALESGCPPHGGIALGLDRLMAIICKARTMRDVIAFPKSLNGVDPLSKAPVPISEEEKALYHLAVIEDPTKSTEHNDEDDDLDAERATPSPEPGIVGMQYSPEPSAVGIKPSPEPGAVGIKPSTVPGAVGINCSPEPGAIGMQPDSDVKTATPDVEMTPLEVIVKKEVNEEIVDSADNSQPAVKPVETAKIVDKVAKPVKAKRGQVAAAIGKKK